MKRRHFLLALAALFASDGIVGADDATSRWFRSSRFDEEAFDEEAFAETQETFALNLYRRATEGEGADVNVLIAPFSVCRCLNALSLGSVGKTKAEIDAALCRSYWDDETWVRAFGAADSSLNAAPETTFAGGIWSASDLPLSETFVERLAGFAQTKATAFDFAAPNARETLNDWFEQNTNGKIKDFFSRLDPATRLLIGDATMFKAQWETPFDELETKTRFFTNVRGEKIPVAMMAQKARFNYYAADAFQYLEAPYGIRRFSFVVVLPRDYRSFAAVDFRLPTLLRECRDRAEETEVKLRLPRFKVERSFDVAATLKKAGVVSAFKDGFDFAPMTDGKEPLKVDQAKQAAFISVDEKGTEAGAATAFMMPVGCVAGPRAEPPKFYADRPFLYFIRNNETGAVLFAGRLVNPKPDGDAEEAKKWEQRDEEQKIKETTVTR